MAGFLRDLKRLSDDLLSRGRKGVDAVAETIDQQAEIRRLATQIRALNQEREERIGSIGKKVYSLYTRDRVANQDILADCKRIDEITEGIGRLRSQIEAVRHGGAEETLVVELTDDTPLEGPAQPGAETSVVEVDTQAGTEAPAAAPEEPAGAQDAPAAAADDSPAQDEDAEAPADEGPAPTGLR
jgi:hypothetical protein